MCLGEKHVLPARWLGLDHPGLEHLLGVLERPVRRGCETKPGMSSIEASSEASGAAVALRQRYESRTVRQAMRASNCERDGRFQGSSN